MSSIRPQNIFCYKFYILKVIHPSFLTPTFSHSLRKLPSFWACWMRIKDMSLISNKKFIAWEHLEGSFWIILLLGLKNAIKRSHKIATGHSFLSVNYTFFSVEVFAALPTVINFFYVNSCILFAYMNFRYSTSFQSLFMSRKWCFVFEMFDWKKYEKFSQAWEKKKLFLYFHLRIDCWVKITVGNGIWERAVDEDRKRAIMIWWHQMLKCYENLCGIEVFRDVQ